MATIEEQYAETQRRARELAEQAEHERAELTRHRAEQTRRRDAATQEFWTQRRSHADPRTDDEWQRFVTAVRDDGDTVSAWRDYRLAVAVKAEDYTAVHRYFETQRSQAADAAAKHYHRVRMEARILASPQADMPADDYRARLSAWRKDAGDYTGRDMSDANPDEHALPLPPHQPIGMVTGGPTPRANGYGEAVDMVVEMLAREAATEAHARRDRALTEHLAAAGE